VLEEEREGLEEVLEFDDGKQQWLLRVVELA
jgi:hypothetical protein